VHFRHEATLEPAGHSRGTFTRVLLILIAFVLHPPDPPRTHRLEAVWVKKIKPIQTDLYGEAEVTLTARRLLL
jgi:hypothetical protein